MARSTLRLIHSRDSTDDLLFRANAHLAGHEPDKALPLYTKVLYETSPGHVCAFLNRSLAYIALGYPELASMDAFRAAVSADATRPTTSIMADTRLRAIAKYFRAETLHKGSGAVWTTPPECYVGPGWLQSPLASIVIGKDVAPDIKIRDPICNELEIRALYRLVGALRECGGGAVREALDILSDVYKKYTLTPMEKHWFDDLGNQILDEIAIMLETDKSPHNSQGELKSRYWKDLEAKTTMVTREVYPWNKHESDYLDDHAFGQLQEYTDLIAKPCIAEYFQSSADEAPTVGLVAARDIYPGEVVLTESSILHVATESMAWSDNYFCDGCGAALLLPNDYLDGIYSRPRGWSPLAASFASQSTHKNTSDEDNGSETDVPVFSQQQQKDPDSFPSPPRPPTPPKPPTIPPHRARRDEADFRLCPSCGEVAFCTDECAVQSSAFHNPLCTTWTESDLREAYRIKRAWTSTVDLSDPDITNHPKKHCIHDLLFVRLIAIAIETNTHPLDLNEVRYLNGGLWPRPIHPPPPPPDQDLYTPQPQSSVHPYPADPSNPSNPSYTSPTPPSLPPQPTENRKSLPWSFESHVLRPLRYFARIGIDTDLMFNELAKYDGWVILTLYAKIERSVRVERGGVRSKPGRWKRYDWGGDVVGVGEGEGKKKGEGVMGQGEGEGEEKRERMMRQGEGEGRGEGQKQGEGEGEGEGEEEMQGDGDGERKIDIDDREKDLRSTGLRGAGNEVWIGSLHTVLSMIGFANEERGERPNVRIREGAKVECVAFSTTSTSTTSTDSVDGGAETENQIAVVEDGDGDGDVTDHVGSASPMRDQDRDQDQDVDQDVDVGVGGDVDTAVREEVDISMKEEIEEETEEEEEVDFIPDSPLVSSGRAATVVIPMEKEEEEEEEEEEEVDLIIPDSPLPRRAKVAIRAGERILRPRREDARMQMKMKTQTQTQTQMQMQTQITRAHTDNLPERERSATPARNRHHLGIGVGVNVDIDIDIEVRDIMDVEDIEDL